MSKTEEMTGAEMVVQALKDNGVDTIFGYPGGAVLPIYDEIFQQEDLEHVLVRHEQGAGHAAEGYARSTGKIGCCLGDDGDMCPWIRLCRFGLSCYCPLWIYRLLRRGGATSVC